MIADWHFIAGFATGCFVMMCLELWGHWWGPRPEGKA